MSHILSDNYILATHLPLQLCGISGILAGVVYACASFAQVAIGWLIDRVSPRLVMFWIALGQVVFIYLASHFENLTLFFLSIAAMCFVFGQILLKKTKSKEILSKRLICG